MFPLNTAGRIGLNVLLFLAGVVALHLGESVIVPMLIALILATVLGPTAIWLHGTKIMYAAAFTLAFVIGAFVNLAALPRVASPTGTIPNRTEKIQWTLSCMTVMIGLILVNVLITAVFSASITRLVARLSNEDEFLNTYKEFRKKVEAASPIEIDETMLPNTPESVRDIGVLKYLVDAVPAILTGVLKYSMSWSWQVIVILFITFFVLLEGKMLARRAVEIFGPSEEVQTKATEVLFEMAKQVRTYLVWRTLINLILAIVMGGVYYWYGLSQAWTWAILLAILNYIPYFGPVLASIPPFLDAFIFSTPQAALVVTIVFWVVVVLEGYLVVPLVMGRNMDLNATTVMVACLFWELVWNTTGLFLAMPIMAGVKAILYHVPEWRVWANLMSTNEVVDVKPKPPDEPPAGTAVLEPSTGGSPNGKAGGTAEGATPHSPAAYSDRR